MQYVGKNKDVPVLEMNFDEFRRLASGDLYAPDLSLYCADFIGDVEAGDFVLVYWSAAGGKCADFVSVQDVLKHYSKLTCYCWTAETREAVTPRGCVMAEVWHLVMPDSRVTNDEIEGVPVYPIGERALNELLGGNLNYDAELRHYYHALQRHTVRTGTIIVVNAWYLNDDFTHLVGWFVPSPLFTSMEQAAAYILRNEYEAFEYGFGDVYVTECWQVTHDELFDPWTDEDEQGFRAFQAAVIERLSVAFALEALCSSEV